MRRMNGEMRGEDKGGARRNGQRQITIRIANAKKTKPKQIITPKEAAMGKWKDKFRQRRSRKRLNIREGKNCDDRVAKHLTQQRLWTNSQM